MRPFVSIFFLLIMLTCYAREAHAEFGEEVASRLKLSPDGKTILWPQPTDDPEDPQNVRLRFHPFEMRLWTLSDVFTVV